MKPSAYTAAYMHTVHQLFRGLDWQLCCCILRCWSAFLFSSPATEESLAVIQSHLVCCTVQLDAVWHVACRYSQFPLTITQSLQQTACTHAGYAAAIRAILMCFTVQKVCNVCRKAAEEGEKQKDGPFFLFIYVDDKICVARGRGGGLAMW